MYFINIRIDWNANQHDGVDFMAKVKPVARRGARKASARGILKHKTSRRKASGTARAAAAVSPQSDVSQSDVSQGDVSRNDLAVEDQLVSSSLSLHELFQQQARQILDRTDLEEDQKQHILVAMSCPCCGAGAMSFTAKLRR
jgi:hypothetical protein